MTTWEVIRWWELRRLFYNAVLFVIGIASLFALEDLVPIGSGGPQLETGLTVIAYGFMANVCYTLGWMVELVGRGKDELRARNRARWHFWVGFWFSCLLTATPLWFGLVFWLAHRKG
jgi:hypothetical protein